MKKALLLIICAFGALWACEKRDHNSVPAGEKEVDMLLSTPQTRSVGSDAENAIKSIQLLVFDGYGVDADNATFLYSRYAWNRDGSNYRAILKIGSNLDIYTAVNADAVIDGAGLTVGMTWSDARKKLTLSSPNLIDVVAGLPMWGNYFDFSVQDQPSNHLGTIKLLRAVASADVQVTATNFTLAKGHIVFGADKGYLPFNPANVDAQYKVTAPDVPSDMVATVDWFYDVEAGVKKIENVFYLYENDAPIADKRYTKMILEGRWASSANPENTFYPLAFREPTTSNKLKTIRNTKYVLIVTNVNGDGYPDLESAKQGEDLNIEYQVVEWGDNVDGEIMIDGSHYMGMQSRTATLFRALGSTKELVFNTNFELTDIKMTFDQGVTAVSGVLDTHPRFKVEVVTLTGDDGTYNCFRITAKQAYGATNNPATVYVTVGRLKFQLKIDQVDRDPNDWNSGGEDPHELG